MGRASKHPPTLLALRLRRARLNSTIGGEPVLQKDMARLCGVHLNTYYAWETGRQLPKAEHMARVAQILGLDGDEVWLDAYHLPPDMHEFLVMTREGAQTVKNLRRIMDTLAAQQKPTRRRGVPEDARLNDERVTALHRDYTPKKG